MSLQPQNLRPVRSAESLVQLRQKQLIQQQQNPPKDIETKVKNVKKSVDVTKRYSRIDLDGGKNILTMDQPESRPMSMDLDELAPLEIVQRAVGASQVARNSPKCHSRSSSHDSYFERKMSSLFGGSSELPTPDQNVTSNLDLSEIQMNFELEENEMRIFSEDEVMSAGSKSPEERRNDKSLLNRKESQSEENSPKIRKISLKEKFKRFTSPTPNRKSIESTNDEAKVNNEQQSSSQIVKIKDRIVGALSPESIRRKSNHTNQQDSSSINSRHNLASSASPSPPSLVKRSKIEVEKEPANDPIKEPEMGDDEPEVMTSLGLPLSPSINFIDATLTESAEQLNGEGSSGNLKET